MSNPGNDGKNHGQPRLGAVTDSGEVQDPFAVEDPCPLPPGAKADTTEEGAEPPVRLEDIKSFRVGDRGEEIKAGTAGSPRPAVAAEEKRLRVKKFVGEAFDDDDGPTPEVMALYWEEIQGELEPPLGKIVYQDLGTTMVLVSGAYSGASREDISMIALALVGDTTRVPFEVFQIHLMNARIASGKVVPQNTLEQSLALEPPVEGAAVGSAQTELDAINSELDTILQTSIIPEGEDDPMPTQDEQLERVTQDGRRSMALGQGSDQGDMWNVSDQSSRIGLARARPGDDFTARRPPKATLASTPAPPVVTKKKPSTFQRMLAAAFLLLIVSLVGLSLSYLYGDSKVVHAALKEETLRNDQQDFTIHELDNRTADVITALAQEKTRVIDLRRERDGYEALAHTVESTRKKDAETILRVNSALKADIGRVRNQTERLETQVKNLQDELRRRESGDKTPSPVP